MRGPAGLAALALVLLPGCAEPRRAGELPPAATESRVDVWIEALEPGVGEVAFTLAAVSLRDEGGELHELGLHAPVVASAELSRRSAVAGGVVPPSTYTSVVLRVERASIGPATSARAARLLPGDAAELPPPELEPAAPIAVEYEVPVRVRIGLRDAASLFLVWDVARSVVAGEGFRGVFSATRDGLRVRLGTLYATDETSGTVLALDRASGAVVGTGKVGSKPTALAVSADRGRVFVANAGDGSLSVLEIRRNRVTSTIPVRLGAGTSDVVVAVPGRLVAATNSALDTVSIFDVAESTRVGDVRVGRGPVRLAAAQRGRRLFVVNSRSDDLSVIDVSSLATVATIPLESEPSDVALDPRERRLVVCHRTSQNLLVLDAASLAVVDSIFVGRDATAVLFDRRRDRVYVARTRPDELAVVDLGLKAVVRRIPLEGAVTSLAQPLDGQSVYGASPGLSAIVVADVVRGGTDPPLPCGSRPTDVVVVD